MAFLRIRHEAPVHGSRCETCTHAHIVLGHRPAEAMVYCTYMSQPVMVRFKVRECSHYSDKDVVSVTRQTPGFKVTTVLVSETETVNE